MEKLTKLQSELLQQLKSDDNNVAMNAVAMLREQGGDFAVIPLMKKYFNNHSEELKIQLGRIFSDLKSSNAGNIISENILKYEKAEALSEFLVELWESSLSFPNLLPFVELLFNENIRVVIETSTLIEENVHILSPENKAGCLAHIKNRIANINDEFHKNIIQSVEKTIKETE